MDTEKQRIEIIDMDISARGIGKLNGKAVFIPDTVTGDSVIYETVSSKKRYDTGRLIDIVSPSKDRRIPKCPDYENCGGCSFLHVSRELELEIKCKAVEASFRRAGIKHIKVEKIISGKNGQYRNKAVFHLNDNGKYGFFSAESHTCSECGSCLLVPNIFNDIIKYSMEYFTEEHPQNIMLRIGNGDVMVAVQTEKFGNYSAFLDDIGKCFPQIVSFYECIGYPTDHSTEYRLHKGKGYIQTDFAGNKLNISPKSFFQINTEIAEIICGEISQSLDLSPNDTVLDLYCGIGTIGLMVARNYPECDILGIEINDSAVSDAMENSRISGINNAQFVCSNAGNIDLSSIHPKAVIVDPPRYGLTDGMIESLLNIDPETIVYMSCNPSSLAGNSLKLVNKYSISRCIAADMFPGCPHVETVVIFKKRYISEDKG